LPERQVRSAGVFECARLDLPDEWFDPFLQPQHANDETSDHRQCNAERNVSCRHLESKQTPKQRHRDLVHHRRGYQVGESHSQGHSALKETNEQGHGGTTAKWSENPDRCGENVTGKRAAAAQPSAYVLRLKPGL
jgi:hypothetical protein